VESIEPVWIFGVIALITGLLLGVLINRLLNPASADVDKLRADLEQERAQMESYKASVNSHFNKTSDLVNELTQDYVKVYQHLAEGAQKLSDTQEFAQVLEQSRGRVLISVEDQSLGGDNVTNESVAEAISAETISAEIPPEQPPADFVDVADGRPVSADNHSATGAGDDAGSANDSPDLVTQESISDSTGKEEAEAPLDTPDSRARTEETEQDTTRKT